MCHNRPSHRLSQIWSMAWASGCSIAQGVEFEPTPYGRALLSRSRAAFDELRLGIRDIESLADPEAGEVRIGSTAATTDTLLPHFIHRFSQRYPRVVVHIDDAPVPPWICQACGIENLTSFWVVSVHPPRSVRWRNSMSKLSLMISWSLR